MIFPDRVLCQYPDEFLKILGSHDTKLGNFSDDGGGREVRGPSLRIKKKVYRYR